jgi:hypothetical protein
VLGFCENGNEPSGSIKFWENFEEIETGGLSRMPHLHEVRGEPMNVMLY